MEGIDVRFQCYRNTDGSYYWRLLSRNHRIVAIAPEGFGNAEEAQTAAEHVRVHAAEAMIDLASDRGVAWQWAMRVDGRVVAVSAHVYGRRVEAQSATQRFRRGAPAAPIAERVQLFDHDVGAREPGAASSI
jgi:uncharacterized protein YegP (UPF0339 family)